MLMRHNVAAGIGSNEQERLCSDLDRKEPRYKSPTLLYFISPEISSTINEYQVRSSQINPILSYTVMEPGVSTISMQI